MNKVSEQLHFLISIAKTQSILSRQFDGALGGVGFNEFAILYHLSQAYDQKLRRIDLAQKMGLTASGITRILLAMEKVGLVTKDVNPHDARVSYVALATGGKRRLAELVDRAEILAEETIPRTYQKKIKEFSQLLGTIHGTI